MLGLGVIEESHSAWASPIVLVKKPDGSWRFCNNFRKLNEISLCDAYPMPRVDELIERLGPARFISSLDLTRGYWQVPLTPHAREKTAFANTGGALPLPGSPVWHAWGPGHLPEADGPGAATPPAVRSRVPR